MTDERERGRFERTGEALGDVAGALGGAASRLAGRVTDAAVGVTGQVLGSMASLLGGWWSGREAERAAASFSDDQDRACEQHFGARPGSRDYSATRPLYQFGHVAGQNPDYQNRSFSEIEPELRQAWERGPGRQHGGWEDVRDYVGFGYGSGSGT